MDKLRQTVKFMRQNGLLKLKTGEFDIELHPAAIAFPAKRKVQDETPAEKAARRRAEQLQAVLDDPIALATFSGDIAFAEEVPDA